MIDITKQEMEYLVSKGVGFGENGICAGKSHHHGWWVTESKRNVALLDEYRRTKTYDSKGDAFYYKKRKG